MNKNSKNTVKWEKTVTPAQQHKHAEWCMAFAGAASDAEYTGFEMTPGLADEETTHGVVIFEPRGNEETGNDGPTATVYFLLEIDSCDHSVSRSFRSERLAREWAVEEVEHAARTLMLPKEAR